MNTQPIKVLYIDDRPGAKPRIVEQQPNDTTLATLQNLVEGMIELVRLPEFPGADLWANEEGLYEPGFQRNTYATLFARSENYHPWPIVGPAVIAGSDDEGRTTSVPQSVLDYFADVIMPGVYTPAQIAFVRTLPLTA